MTDDSRIVVSVFLSLTFFRFLLMPFTQISILLAHHYIFSYVLKVLIPPMPLVSEKTSVWWSMSQASPSTWPWACGVWLVWGWSVGPMGTTPTWGTTWFTTTGSPCSPGWSTIWTGRPTPCPMAPRNSVSYPWGAGQFAVEVNFALGTFCRVQLSVQDFKIANGGSQSSKQPLND